jgi:hypothetical protein
MISSITGCFIVFVSLLAPLHAQVVVACPPVTYTQSWVDPVNGSDPGGVVGNAAFPFRTLNFAIQNTAAAAGGGHGLVTALPGIYSTATNGEVLPVRVPDGIHVLGIGAKECVLRGGGLWNPLPNSLSFLPTLGTVPLGTHGPFEVGFWFANATATDDFEASVENFTIQGCKVQAYGYNEGDLSFRVSNCLFDMRDNGIDFIAGPDFGVLMVDGVQTIGGQPTYHKVTPKIFNNTFIQATQLGDGFTIEAAVPQNVAICNSNDPAPLGFIEDPTPFLFGPDKPSIQNNLIRDLPGFKRTAMLGIDRTDTTVSVGTFIGSTNAFDKNEALNVDLTGTYQAQIIGLVPTPRVNTASRDPGFVGELIGKLKFAAGLPFWQLHDFRLIPDSVLADRGSSPRYTTTCNGTFTAGNGTTYIDHPITAWKHGAFDYDGEGHGNFRTVATGTAVVETDIGFDEIDNLIVAGSYGNESKSHNIPWDFTINFGDSNRSYIAPVAAGAPPVFMSLFGTSSVYPPAAAFDFYPGLAPLGASFIPAPGMAPSFFWLAGPIALFGNFPMTPTAVADVLNPLSFHNFLLFQSSITEIGPPTYFNEQVIYVDAAGNPILNFPLNRLSNAQSELF